MDNLHLGQLITTAQSKDAIHIAVAPVTAAESLKPGQHIGFLPNSRELVGAADKNLAPQAAPARRIVSEESFGVAHGKAGMVPIGIVDPYLREAVKKGEKFWAFLYPGSITSLRHDWTHPAFEISGSEQWLHDYAEEVGVGYEILMEATQEYLRRGDGYILGFDTPDCVYQKREQFWEHYEAFTGTKIKNKDATFFSCSC